MLPSFNTHDVGPPFLHAMQPQENMFLPYAHPHFIPFTGLALPEPRAHFHPPYPNSFVDNSLLFEPQVGQRPLQPYVVEGHNGYFYHSSHPGFVEQGLPHPHSHHHPRVYMHDPRLTMGIEYAPHPPPNFYPHYQPPAPPPSAVAPPPRYSPTEHQGQILPSGSPHRVEAASSSKLSQPQKKSLHRQCVSMSRGGAIPTNHVHRRSNTWLISRRSAFLEHFRNTRDNEQWALNAISGYVVEFSSDQHGSRFIQAKLETSSHYEKAAIFAEIYPQVDTIIRDVFGNYILQKFFDVGTEAQKSSLLHVINRQVFDLSVHIYGCRVVQKALDVVSQEQQSSIVSSLSPRILECIKNGHGNHVAQKIIEVVAPERVTFLRRMSDNIFELSTHAFGCRVLQRCIEHLPASFTQPLLDAILTHTLDLMQDQYGNYVIQYIIKHGCEHNKSKVYSTIKGRLVGLSCHKFASNVCEKALLFSDRQTRESLIDEIIGSHLPDGESAISSMAKDQYGNYVLQRALTLSEGSQRESLFASARAVLAELRKITTSHIRPLNPLERLMDELSTPSD